MLLCLHGKSLGVSCIVVNLIFTGKKGLSAPLPKELNTVGDHLRKARLLRYQTQKEVSELVDVEHISYNRWECNKNEVDIKCMPKVIEYLGYNPIVQEAKTLGERLKKYRVERGLSYEKLSKEIGLDRDVLRRVEKGEVKLKRKTVLKVQGLIKNLKSTSV